MATSEFFQFFSKFFQFFFNCEESRVGVKVSLNLPDRSTTDDMLPYNPYPQFHFFMKTTHKCTQRLQCLEISVKRMSLPYFFNLRVLEYIQIFFTIKQTTSFPYPFAENALKIEFVFFVFFVYFM